MSGSATNSDDVEFIRSLYLECQDCGEVKDDVEETTCPYASEIYGKIVNIRVCSSCEIERGRDV